MASAASAQQTPSSERPALLATVETRLGSFDVWASVGPANFAHKRDLIRAELLHAREEREPAAAAYEAAVLSAGVSGFVHDHALAHERAAMFYQASNEPAKSRAHLQLAAMHYEKWEPWAKISALRKTGLERS